MTLSEKCVELIFFLIIKSFQRKIYCRTFFNLHLLYWTYNLFSFGWKDEKIIDHFNPVVNWYEDLSKLLIFDILRKKCRCNKWIIETHERQRFLVYLQNIGNIEIISLPLTKINHSLVKNPIILIRNSHYRSILILLNLRHFDILTIDFVLVDKNIA